MLIILPVDACVAEVDSFVSQRIPESDGEFSPLLRKKGWKKRRMTTKEPAGITMQDLRGKSQRVWQASNPTL